MESAIRLSVLAMSRRRGEKGRLGGSSSGGDDGSRVGLVKGRLKDPCLGEQNRTEMQSEF